jgi:hydroxymethylpyrimidine pyrophosphatase-like HAD family hydrolase
MVLEAGGDEVSATKSKPRFIDITAAKAHKGMVVTHLSSLLNIPTDRIAVIGDGLNDILSLKTLASASRWDKPTKACVAQQML